MCAWGCEPVTPVWHCFLFMSDKNKDRIGGKVGSRKMDMNGGRHCFLGTSLTPGSQVSGF